MSLQAVLKRSQDEPENWHYTNLEKLLQQKNVGTPSDNVVALDYYKDASTQDKPQLIFVDGVYKPEQSQLETLPGNFLQGSLATGYRLTLAGQTCLATSLIELIWISTGQISEIEVNLSIELGANGRLSLVEKHSNSGSSVTLVNTRINLQAQAKLVHGKIISGQDHTHLALTDVAIAEGGFYDNFTLIKGGRLVRNEIEVALKGKLAQCALNGVMLLHGHQHADTTTRIVHKAPHGTSREVYKTVLADQAHGVFQGKIIVEPHAQKTDGYQLSRALLLSDQAEMNTKPELEIHADDVKCSHGSTIGDLDVEALFYLRARGLSEVEARALLIEAFVNEILDEIHIPEWRDTCRSEVEGWLHERH